MGDHANAIVSRIKSARMARLDRLLYISVVAWCFVSIESFWSGYHWNGLICGIAGLGCFTLAPLAHRGVEMCARAAHLQLIICALAILLMSLVTGQSQSYSSLFFCCFGLFAAHTLGKHASFVWTAISIVALTLLSFDLLGFIPQLREHTAGDKAIHLIALTLVIYFINWQAQHYFDVQSREMIRLTTDLENKAHALEKVAQFDSLTGLFNRHNFQRQVRVSMMHAEEEGEKFALLLLDLNGFKEINDTLGHQMGDAILQQVAERLLDVAKADRLVARLGGDEFTVLVENVKTEADIEFAASDIIEALSRPYRLAGKDYNVGVSIGAATYPTHATSLQDLLAFADVAMYRSKGGRLGLVIYDAKMSNELRERQELETRLCDALNADEFAIHYQPQVCITSHRVVGLEALLRWNRDGTWQMPKAFLDTLESIHEINSVGRWVLESACRQGQNWHEKGFPIRVSVNVSALQFQSDEFCDHVVSALECSRLDPAYLDLEITESTLIHDIHGTSETLRMLRELGVSISIDDFGTGYSSLAYLKDIPINRLKIDRTFIQDIPERDNGTIARAIINLARTLDLDVLAEGVEQKGQLAFLKDAGCREYQGFLFSKPISVEECESLLAKSYRGGRCMVKSTQPMQISELHG